MAVNGEIVAVGAPAYRIANLGNPATILAVSDVTHILEAVARGDPAAAEELLPLVYEELRRLAAAKMAQQPPGQTLQATALVHEAWLRTAAISSPPRPKPCATFSSNAPATN